MVVTYLQISYHISERRACQTVRCAKATYRYRSHRDPHTALQQRMREMAQTRVRYGHGRKSGIRLRSGNGG